MDDNNGATALISRYGFIEVLGDEATGFLQSQLSADVAALADEQAVLTGWHDPKGRVLSCLKVVRKKTGFWLVLPASLAAETLTGFTRYVFRTKVTLTNASDRLAAAAVLRGTAENGERYEVYAAKDELAARVARHYQQGVRKLDEAEWELGDIRAGLPEIYPATRGMYTGQMLNLDLIGGISFSKGCYPGQEIIARTHHLGRVKRRMQRYVSDGAPRTPGESLSGEDGRRAGQVVRSVATATGSESLVVAAVDTPPSLTSEDNATLIPADLPYPLT